MKTAVEWLLSVVSLSEDAWIEIEKYESKAKQMEKEQTMEDYSVGYSNGQVDSNRTAEQYYTETYKNTNG